MEAVQTYIESSPLLCFFIVALVYMIGDVIGTLTKAWVPSLFVVAVLFLAGYWTFSPRRSSVTPA